MYGKLHPLFRLPWFRRVWAFQETVLARKVVCYCGEHTFSFEDLVHAADFKFVPYSNPDATALHWATYVSGHSWAIQCLQQKEQGKETVFHSADLLLMAGELNATRPEDKIYGLYGCATRLGLDWPTPDYTKSVAQIYIEATVASFRKDNDIGIMGMAIDSAVGELGLPSWVPEFSGPTHVSSLSKPPKLAAELLQDKQCSGASQCEWNFIPEQRHLKVKGRRFDYITAVSEPWRTISLMTLPEDTSIMEARVQNLERFKNCIGSWFEVTLQRNKIRESSTSLADKLVAISDLADLVANADPEVFGSSDRVAENFSRIITYTGKSGDLLTFLADCDDDNVETIRQAVNNMLQFQWKLIFRTTNKLCIGISNYNAEAGDLLVVFHGMKSPCVIRPCAGGFNFIGSAFVEGILNGEFWEGGSNEDDEWFTLI